MDAGDCCRLPIMWWLCFSGGRGASDKEFFQDVFAQAFGHLGQFGCGFARVAKIAISKTGLGLADIDASRLRAMLEGRIRSPSHDTIRGVIEHAPCVFANRQEQTLRKTVYGISREMICRGEIDGLKQDELFNLRSANERSSTDRLPGRTRLRIDRTYSCSRQQSGRGTREEFQKVHSEFHSVSIAGKEGETDRKRTEVGTSRRLGLLCCADVECRGCRRSCASRRSG